MAYGELTFIDGMAEGLTEDEKYQQGWHDALEKQGEHTSTIDVDAMVEKYKQEQFPLHNSSTSSHSPYYYPVRYIDNMIAQYRKGINDTLNMVLGK